MSSSRGVTLGVSISFLLTYDDCDYSQLGIQVPSVESEDMVMKNDESSSTFTHTDGNVQTDSSRFEGVQADSMNISTDDNADIDISARKRSQPY